MSNIFLHRFKSFTFDVSTLCAGLLSNGLLCGPSWLASQVCHLWSVESLWWVCQCWHEIAAGTALVDDVTILLHTNIINAIHVLSSQMSFTILFALGQCNVQWFCAADSTVHFGHRFGGFLWIGETNETESLRKTNRTKPQVIKLSSRSQSERSCYWN